MKQQLFALQSNNGTFIYLRQTGENEVEVYESDKPYTCDLWEKRSECVEIKKGIEEGHKFWDYEFDQDILPLKIRTISFELEADEFEIVEWNNIERLDDRYDVTVKVKWSEETMKECELENPYVIISMDKYGTVIPSKEIGIDDGGYSSGYMLHSDDAKKVERYVSRNKILHEELNIYRPRMGYDYFEKESPNWVHVYEVKDKRVYFNIADKDWTNADLSIEEFMDKYDTRNPGSSEDAYV